VPWRIPRKKATPSSLRVSEKIARLLASSEGTPAPSTCSTNRGPAATPGTEPVAGAPSSRAMSFTVPLR
jgi:hypothetical protein